MSTLVMESDTVITKKSSFEKDDASFTSSTNEYEFYDTPEEENKDLKNDSKQ